MKESPLNTTNSKKKKGQKAKNLILTEMREGFTFGRGVP